MIFSLIFSRLVFAIIVPTIILSYLIINNPNILFFRNDMTENDKEVIRLTTLLLFLPLLFNITFCIFTVFLEFFIFLKKLVFNDILFQFINNNYLISWPITFCILLNIYLMFNNFLIESQLDNDNNIDRDQL
jgi:hypothetical protein